MADTISLLLCFLCFMTGLLSGSSKEEIIKQVVAREWLHKSYTFAGIGQTWTKEEKETFSLTCGVGDAAEIWFISNYVKLDDAFNDSVLYVDLDAELTLCVNERTSTKVPCHSNIFEIYVFRGESQPPIPSTQKLTYLLSNFYPVYNITNKTSPNSVNRRENQTFSFKRNNTKGVTFAVRSRGACGKLYHMKMYYFYCEKTFIDGVMFEKTASPAVGFRNVTGNCSPNSQPQNNGTKPKGFCHSNGSWGADYQIKCLCSQGYETSNEKGCSACTKDYYKETVSNSECNPCPSNTVSLNNRTACECKENFYNLANDRLKPSPCYALPAMNGNPTAKDGVGEKVNVTWSQASTRDSLNESVLYDVECFSCDNDVCSGPCIGAAYHPGQHNLSQTFVVVSDLKSHPSYEFRIYPRNSLNELVSKEKWNFTTARYERRKDEPTGETKLSGSNRLYFIIAGVVGLALITVVVFLVIFVVRRKEKGKKVPTGGLSNSAVQLLTTGQRLYVDPTTYESPEDAVCQFASELDPNLLFLETFIGGGEFGDVYRGKLKRKDESKIPVAVKTLKHDATIKSEKDFLLEASVMGQFDNPNVVRLEGVVTKTTPRMIVIEYMSNGSLDHFLKDNENMLTRLQLIGMARGVAAGMKYLAGIKFVHRDLAARNILVNDTLFCKISDFGLSRELETTDSSRGEYATSGGKIPVRWTAPEAIKYRKFSTASDVWSFGILLWEIMSFSERPYWDWDNYKVLEQLDKGYRLPPPLNCPKGVHSLMLQCWNANRAERPTFTEIALIIDKWIRSPETLNNDVDISSTLSEWLDFIKMANYSNHFSSAGYKNPSDIMELKDEDLKKMGITLIGHRNKILKGIDSLRENRISVAI